MKRRTVVSSGGKLRTPTPPLDAYMRLRRPSYRFMTFDTHLYPRCTYPPLLHAVCSPSVACTAGPRSAACMSRREQTYKTFSNRDMYPRCLCWHVPSGEQGRFWSLDPVQQGLRPGPSRRKLRQNIESEHLIYIYIYIYTHTCIHNYYYYYYYQLLPSRARERGRAKTVYIYIYIYIYIYALFKILCFVDM